MSESKGLWFLVGLSLGALAGILYAPQSGEQTREMLRSKADEGRDRVQQTVSDVRDKVGNLRSQVNDARDQAVDIAGRGKQAVTRQIDQFQAAVEAGKQAYRESAGLGKGEKLADEAAQL
ncbi:MAG TPA: YtxH domain-containing protein [Terriglobales bacterium]|jgi:gas vesicle protein